MCDLKDRFAANLWDWRHRRHMTQAELARAAKTSVDTIGKYERAAGSPTLKTICDIAEALDCEPNDLFGWTIKEVA